MNHSNIKNMIDRYAKSRISEQTKIREVLQETALLGLQRHGFFEKAAFYGGTALRILYGLDRFSEDLDFTLLKPDPDFDFNPFLDGMRRELLSFGFNMEVASKDKNIETSVVSAFMKINTIQLYLAIGDEKKTSSINHNEKIQIKLEVDIAPPPYARIENQLIQNPLPFYVLTLNKSDLFAGKMHAILFRSWKNRIKGRDWYDLIWYIRKKIPLSLRYLESCLRQAGNLRPEEMLNRDWVVKMLTSKIQQIDWNQAKKDVHSFIVNPEVLEIWSVDFFTDLIKNLIVE